MPYIADKDRLDIDCYVNRLELETPGELNYAITRMIDNYIIDLGKLSYSRGNEVVGVLECAKLEFYRKILAPYEDKKLSENGGVHRCD